jgi:hypothetical protein
MTLVEAPEINPPANQEPLHWRLLTSLEVGDADAACEIVRLYRLRWRTINHPAPRQWPQVLLSL